MKNNILWILMNPQSGARNRRRGLTLVELLVVICLIAVLCMLTVTMVSKARQSSRSTRCFVSLRQIFVAPQIYSQDHNGQVVPGESWNGSTHLFWHWILRPDLNGRGVFDDVDDAPLRCMHGDQERSS